MKNLIIVILLAIIFFFVGKNAISEIEENQEDISTFIESFANEKPAEELYQKAQEQEEMRNSSFLWSSSLLCEVPGRGENVMKSQHQRHREE